MFEVDTKEIKRFEKDLKLFAQRALPFATKNTLNRAAFTAQKIAKEQVSKDLTLRNKFTVQSIRVEQARSLNIRSQVALMGSIAPYMADQEFGGVKTRKGSEGTPIATSVASGEGDNARPRERLPRKANKLPNIRLKKSRVRAKGRRQRNVVAVKQAARTGQKYVFLELSRRKGIFKVFGGKRKPRVKMIWDLTRTSVFIPANPWLAPTIEKTRPEMPKIYRDSLMFQLKRQGLFK